MGSLSGKRIMVTSGGTREYIDDVRVVTNISTGALGVKIAEDLFTQGAEVFFVFGKQSYLPSPPRGIDSTSRISTFGIVTAHDLMETMESLVKGFKIDAVVHAAAVSDFTFKRDGAVKLSSSSADDFINYMRDTITPNPKIIKKIKTWRRGITLVGFKFTVGSTYDEQYEAGRKLVQGCDADAVLINDKEDMTRSGKHLGHLLVDSVMHPLEGKPGISRTIVQFLQDRLK